MANRAARLDRFANEIQLLQHAVFRPRFVKLTNGGLRLNPESPQSQHDSAHRDDWPCSGPHMATVGASDYGLCDSPGKENLLEALLKPLS